MRKRSLSMLLIVTLLLCQTGCGKSEQTVAGSGNTATPTQAQSQTTPTTAPTVTPEPTATPAPTPTVDPAKIEVKPYDDLRVMQGTHILQEGEYNIEDISTFWLNNTVVFKGNEDLMAQIFEDAKNPGLGVRELHKQGITGKGVNVAIIDQNLFLDHPEYNGKITEYYDTGCDAVNGSMHGPAVASLLVGDNTGVAPGAKLYYAAAPSWLADSSYYAKALDWIVETNKKLPEGEKIRVVSVSAAPSGEATLFTKNTEMWDEAILKAKADGILVLDCGSIEGSNFIRSCYYDLTDREDPSKCCGGYPAYPQITGEEYICAPTSPRTTAEEYEKGKCDYQYTGQGGLSWGIPYIAGVLALGWQINPDLTNDEIVKILFDTRVQGRDGSYIVNPPAFIEEVKKTVN